MFYVYEAKIDNNVIYIGKGTKNRYKHCYRKWKNCEVNILEYFDSSEDAFKKEKELIKKYGRLDLGTGLLLNKNNGGEYIKGSIYWKDKKLSKEHKEKISKTLINKKIKSIPLYGENNGFYQKKHSTETKLKISNKLTGRISGFKGKFHTTESKEKNRNAHLGKPSKRKIIFDVDLIIKMKYYDRLTNKEIADYFNCSIGPIKNIIKQIKNIYNNISLHKREYK